MAPCGRVLRSIGELDRYLFLTNSKLTIDMFSFDTKINTNREFEANAKYVKADDITLGNECVPISCVNCVDTSRPDEPDGHFVYSSRRMALHGVPLANNKNTSSDPSSHHAQTPLAANTTDSTNSNDQQQESDSKQQHQQDDDLMSGCGCTDNCRDRTKCACWRKTFEATTFVSPTGQMNTSVGYHERRLNDLVMTGIFECNPRCKCDCRCANRVVQNGVTVRLQLFKTSNGKGWGVRCLDDVAQGTFISSYVGHLLSEEQSDIRGAVLGDEVRFLLLDF